MNQAWKIRAGEFLPGANLTVLPHWERKAAPVYGQAEVSVPGRLHFAVFDFLQMAPGLGGGGLGVSTSTVGHQVIVAHPAAGEGRFLGNLNSENLWVTTAVGNYDTLATETLKAHGEGADMSGTTEAGFVPSHFVEWQKRYGEAWRNFIEKKLRPALHRNDLFGFLKHGWELNSMSNMKVLEGIFRTDVMREFDETMQR